MRRGGLMLGVATAAVAIACQSTLDPSIDQLLTPPDSAIGYYGDGSDGPLEVTEPQIVTFCHPAESDGNLVSILSPTDGGLRAGGLVLLHQTRSLTDAGAWEVARVVTVNPGSVQLFSAPQREYRTDGEERAQICTVPQYTTVTVRAGATISGPSWDGTSGGVVAFFARESVVLDSASGIESSAAGFAPGLCDKTLVGSVQHMPVPDEMFGMGLAGGKGEGYGGIRNHTGTQHETSGGGGGALASGGGGGGAHVGAGGRGGNGSDRFDPGDADLVAGEAAPAVPFEGVRLLFGGGGGAPQREEFSTMIDGEPDLCGGGPGGGVVLIAAPSILGMGTVNAAGGVGSPALGVLGAGGGGAGGTILIHSEHVALVNPVSVRGGDGGIVVTTNGNFGPGGGGGGGHVWTRRGLFVPAKTDGGSGGVVTDESGAVLGAHGAGPGSPGVSESY